MKVHELIQEREVYCASTGQTVQDAVDLMAEKGVGALPVLDKGKLVGIFSERDVLRRIIALRKNPAEVKVEKAMTGELIIASPDSEVNECIALMRKYSIRHIPIVKDLKLTGIVSLRDLLQVDLEDKKFEIRVLNEYIHYIPPFAMKE